MTSGQENNPTKVQLKFAICTSYNTQTLPLQTLKPRLRLVGTDASTSTLSLQTDTKVTVKVAIQQKYTGTQENQLANFTFDPGVLNI